MKRKVIALNSAASARIEVTDPSTPTGWSVDIMGKGVHLSLSGEEVMRFIWYLAKMVKENRKHGYVKAAENIEDFMPKEYMELAESVWREEWGEYEPTPYGFPLRHGLFFTTRIQYGWRSKV